MSTIDVSSGTTSSGLILNDGDSGAVAGTATDVYVNSGATLSVSSGGSLLGGTAIAGGLVIVDAGGSVSGLTLSSGGQQEVSSGGTAMGTIVQADANLNISAGAVVTNTDVQAGGTINVLSGGTDSSSILEFGAQAIVNSGGVALGTPVDLGVNLFVSSGGTSIGATINGGYFSPDNGSTILDATLMGGFNLWVYSGTVVSGTTAGGNSVIHIENGAITSGTQVQSGATVVVDYAGTDFGTTLSSGGLVWVNNGGVTSNLTVGSDGWLAVFAGGTSQQVEIQAGGSVSLQSGATAIDTKIDSGASLIAYSATTATDLTVMSGATLTYMSGATVDQLTLDNAATLQLSSGTDSATMPQPSVIVTTASAMASAIFQAAMVITYPSIPDVSTDTSVQLTSGLAIIDTEGLNDVMSGQISGSGGLVVSGGGTLSLAATNTYTGGTVLADDATTLVLAAPSAAGGGSIRFAGTGQATLLISSAALVNQDLVNVISGFNTNSVIDLVDIAGASSPVLASDGTLTIQTTSGALTLHLAGGNGLTFSTASDGGSGTLISIAQPTITSIALEVNENTSNDALTITLAPDQTVTVDTNGGSPYVTLSNGTVATYSGQDSQGRLVFTATLSASENVTTLKVSSLTLNGASITDTVGLGLDLSGFGSLSTGLTIVPATSASTATISLNPLITNYVTPTLNGTSTADAVVTIALDGTVVGTTTANGSGAWSYTFTSDVAVGVHDVAASILGTDGTTSLATVSTKLIETTSLNLANISDTSNISILTSEYLGETYALQFISGTASVTLPDGVLSVSPTTPQAYIARLYKGLLGRTGESPGIGFWNTLTGTANFETTLAQAFLDSPEYRASATTTNQAFVTQLYNGLLNRAPDTAGQSYWTDLLDTSTATRAQVVAGIASSTESQQTLSTVTSNVWAPDPNAQAVIFTYETTLDRLPENAGLSFWLGLLQNGTNLAQMLNAFTQTPEYQSAHDGQSATDLVTSLYTNALGRDPSATELSSAITGIQNNTAPASVVIQSLVLSSQTYDHLGKTL